MEIASLNLQGDKLVLVTDRGTAEYYLPDSNSVHLMQWLADELAPTVDELSRARPWATPRTAKLIRKVSNWRGNVGLYALSHAVHFRGHDVRFVFVSSVPDTFGSGSQPETYIFAAASADVTYPLSWGEMDGSFRGGMDHARALKGLGFELVN